MDRPDLDEFLGALSGFVGKKNASPTQDPTYFRFLEIFCRSVGSSEGHLLQYTEGKGLRSVVSSGLPKDFDRLFNDQIARAPENEPSPIHRAHRDQQVTAVVEIKKDAGMPVWFLEFMRKVSFKALVAVPLLGQTRSVGVLCAYYRDVCLFDQGTLERLMTIGRMVGTAIENSGAGGSNELASPPSIMSASSGSAIDDFLAMLMPQIITQTHVYEALAKSAGKGLSVAGIVCGPLRISAGDLLFTAADGAGVPSATLSKRFTVPPLLGQSILVGKGAFRKSPVATSDLGALQPIVAGKSVSMICQPIVWRKQSQAAVIAWRGEDNPFTETDEQQLARLSGISSLTLRSL